MAWQVSINILIPRQLLRQGNSFPIVQACVSEVDASHHWLALEVVSNLIVTTMLNTKGVLVNVSSPCRLPFLNALASAFVGQFGCLLDLFGGIWLNLCLLRAIFLSDSSARIAAPTGLRVIVCKLHQAFKGFPLVTPINHTIRKMQNALLPSFIEVHFFVFEE